MRPCHRKPENYYGAQVPVFPEWCIVGLIYIKMCKDNSMPRQFTNPFNYALGGSHKPVHLCRMAQGNDLLVQYSRQGEDSQAVVEKK